MTFKIPLFEPNFDDAERKAVCEAIESGWISMGPATAEFERRFAQFLGMPHAIALSSGTAALHLAMILAEVGPGDEVIVPSLTFVATVNAVRYVGATPVFADICGEDDISIDPDDVEKKLTSNTRAILTMHYGGFPCDLVALRRIAESNGLALIEDSAHAPYAERDGIRAGTAGQLACFSFFSNKNMTCAEGGMLVTGNEAMARRARLLRSHGMTTLSYERASGHATRYDVVELGYNYRLDDIRARLALAQLDKLPADLEHRARARAKYIELLSVIEEVTIPYLNASGSSSNYIFPVVIRGANAEKRDRIRQSMAETGVQTSVHYPAVHRFSIYREFACELPRTEGVADSEITLPLYGSMTEESIAEVVVSLKEALTQEGQ